MVAPNLLQIFLQLSNVSFENSTNFELSRRPRAEIKGKRTTIGLQAGEESLHPLLADEEIATLEENYTEKVLTNPEDGKREDIFGRDNKRMFGQPIYPPFGAYTKLNIDDEVRKALQIKSSADGTEQLLYRTLMDASRYEKDVRPTNHHSLPTNVTFGFLLNQIVEMDERNQVLTTRSWLNINWMDQRLSWNHSLWGGIKTIYVPHQKLWKPDIILVNNAIREYYASLVSTDIMVSSDGNVTYLYSAIFRSSCRIKVRYYPFDDQECDLKFASWSHDSREMDLGLNTDKGDLSSYMNNSEFDLVDMTAIREVVHFPSEPDSLWPIIIIRINMRRRPLFYVFNHIIPCVLISSMAVLGFLMPPETGEKINMIITTLLSMGVYLQSITESIPPTSEAVPLIGMYYVASLFMVCLATCVNVVTLNIHRNGAANQGRQVPPWMEKYILGYLASFMQMTIREPDSVTLIKTAQTKKSTIRRSSLLRDLKRIKNQDNRKQRTKVPNGECECMVTQNNNSVLTLEIEAIHAAHAHSKANGNAKSVETGSEGVILSRIVTEQLMPRMTTKNPTMLSEFEQKFRKILKRIYRSLQQHEIREEILDERQRIQWQWQQLASVIDRLLLILFSMATLATISFFLILPVQLRNSVWSGLFFL
ncbi:unnamed protein product, partial [Mesorhabditis belari]|uniref:Ligand-gated ion channel 4 n=1 Tax=Mesorhabditis belari TaxID=2138241 RepID=A0AAF3JAQ0_9BILA